ncbi:alpha-1,4-glucan--maltose-1-phosphate maltosyltransferase [Klugiella xanthotipulae]
MPFAITAFREGHDRIGAHLILISPLGDETTHVLAELDPGSDRWGTRIRLDTEGEWAFHFRGFSDDYATWLHNAQIKIPARVDVDVMLALGQQIVTRGAKEQGRPAVEKRLLTTLATALGNRSLTPEKRLEVASGERVRAVLALRPIAELSSVTGDFHLLVERERAGVGSWYEFFPRSEGAVRRADGSWRSGTFATAARRLPAISNMGFDVVYLPPIHPIGRSFRKGPNNTLTAGPHDPGSPWAIGAAEGGHDAIHPDLGTVADFTAFCAVAATHNMEVALDLALQASPDHPWVLEHPEWFTTLPDGSIAHAENPPKKYQDIYPINFDNDPEGIYAEVLGIVRLWISRGIHIFRVDNPHTKPVHFWERLIGEVTSEHPGVIFLAEAFTRPALLRTLAQVGFQQSYTYFTWRNTREDLAEFLTSVTTETADYLRPNFFVNTPDILTEYLQFGGRPAYKIRAALAATTAPTWGMYSGYELIENVARPGAEENLDSEKYEYRPRDYAAAEREGRSLVPYITRLNDLRRTHPALRQLRNLTLHSSDDDSILVYSKHLAAEHADSGQSDTLIVVVNVDPHNIAETVVHLNLTALGLAPGSSFPVTDLLTDATWMWSEHNYVRLDPEVEPVHILRLDGASRG